MKFLRPILGMVVGAIILLHTFVPHEHYNSSSEAENLRTHECSVSFFMGLQISLGLNHGAGHFEQYVEADHSSDDYTLPVLYQIPAPLIAEYFCASQDSRATEAADLTLDRLRGPPNC